MLDFLTRDLCSIDVETTGLNPKEDRVIQLGIYVITPDGKHREGVQLFNPKCSIPEETTKVHGITDEMVKDAPHFEDAAEQISRGLENCDVCGYNVDFDLGFLRVELKRCNMELTHGFIVDAHQIFRRYKPHTLIAARKEYLNETDTSDAHNAIVDAKKTLEIFTAQIHTHDLPRDISAIHKLIREMPQAGYLDPQRKFIWHNGKACINFGKYKMWPLQKVEPDYLEWMLQADFSPKVKAIVRDALDKKFPTR